MQYPTDPNVEANEVRSAVEGVSEVQFRDIASRPPSGFSYTPPKKKEKKSERVCFDARVVDLDKVRRHVRRASLRPSEIGKLTFVHYIKAECAAD